jgi:hypothetical protein
VIFFTVGAEADYFTAFLGIDIEVLHYRLTDTGGRSISGSGIFIIFIR